MLPDSTAPESLPPGPAASRMKELGEGGYRCRVRVWPRGADASCVAVAWILSRQPLVRPACYEDDPLQAGVSAVPAVMVYGPEPA